MTRRRLLASVGAALGLWASAAFVAPGADAATTPVTIAFADAGPVNVDPAGHGATTLAVTNHDGRSHTVRLWLTSGTTDVPSWVLLADTEVAVAANSTLDVALSVDPPSTAAPGRIDLAAAAQLVDTGAPGATTPSAAFGVVVRGTPSAVVRIAAVSTAREGRASVVRVDVRNDGAVGANLSGTLVVAPSGERRALRVHVDAHASTTVTVPWSPPSGAQASGRIDLVAGNESVSWSGALGAAANLGAAPGTTSPATPSVASIAPAVAAGGLSWGTVLVVLALLGASGWLGYEIFAGRQGVALEGAPAPESAAPVQALPVDQLTPLVEAIAHLSASIGDRREPQPPLTLPAPDAVRNEVLGLVACGLGVSRLQLLDWLPDELFERAAVELRGEPELDRLVIELRATEIERAILRRALGQRVEGTES